VSGARNPNWIYRLTAVGEVFNYSGYSNPTFENLIETALAMENSPEKYHRYIEAFKIIMNEVPVILSHVPGILAACRTNIKNFHAHFGQRVCPQILDIE